MTQSPLNDDHEDDDAHWSVSDSIRVAASPDVVYDLVSDVTRTGEWSPECRAAEWVAESLPGGRVGDRFLGHNDDGNRQWTTTSEVVVADRPTRFEWVPLVDVLPGGGGVHWAYRIEHAEGGSLLTEEWVFPRDARERYDARYEDGDGPERRELRRRNAVAGIPATLRRIKVIAEGDLPPA
ncbi:SRPBCC family protein [Pseudoclavibacter chungangensis]|uniref:SRPBCC family protein n=1 Tax=Pseudoclavibacter chungangensis TaxID=587635 RepID=A0A7J5BQ54_9MICO|nr:SRPBCC family protein [Pseudoclavibacter chungangensis]KAB1655641.1 SRPBCC family protein [Pseudoclavibacter chungangensis]NYJ67957.1 hypothetical protein [Pseudoclavibacter chungangensis]